MIHYPHNARLVAHAISFGGTAEHGRINIGFNMADYVTPNVLRMRPIPDRSGRGCGTVACVGGWTMMLIGPDSRARRRPLDVADLAEAAIRHNLIDHVATAFGISDDMAQALCAPECPDWSGIPAQHVVRVLNHLADTGTVDWRT